MILTNAKWKADLAREQKKALYVLAVPEYNILITSFLDTDLCASDQTGLVGYGVVLYGDGGYGS
jgi:hypothetical protein